MTGVKISDLTVTIDTNESKLTGTTDQLQG
jgi:hypothetical protein